MAVGRGGAVAKTIFGFLVYGAQGAWKSSMALESLKFIRDDGKPFRVLYIDAEQGSVDSYLEEYANKGYDLQNIFIVYTQSITEVKEFIKRAKNNENFYEFDELGNETENIYLDADGQPFHPDMIVVDGATLLYIARQQGLTEFSKLRATVRAKQKEMVGLEKQVSIQGAALEIKDYNTLKFDGQDLILDLLGSNKHFIVTAREEDEKERVRGKDGTFESVLTGNKIPSGFKDIRYNVKTVIHTFIDDDGVVKAIVENKDRTLVHKQNEMLIEPTLTDWAVALVRNNGKKTLNNSNNLGNAVMRELQDVEDKDMTFDKTVLGSSENGVNTIELKTVEEYRKAIEEFVGKLNKVDKAKKQGEIDAAGLPKAYQKIEDIEQLKKFYKIVTGK
jgi:soluble cytochrome b562